MTIRALVLLATVAALAGPAGADSTQVFPLAANGVPQARAESLTRSLASAIHADVATVPIEDAAGLLECDIAATPCLDAVAKSVSATRLVYGVVSRGGASTKVTLTRFEGGSREQRDFELVSPTDEALGQELVRASAEWFGITPPPAPPPTETPPAREVPPPSGDVRSGSIKGTTWLLLGTGLVVAGVGTGFLVSSNNIENDVAAAPRETVADFQHLVELEDKGTLHRRLGQGFAIGGTAIVAIAVWRMLVDRSRVVRVEPAPVRGGATVSISWELP